MFPAGDDKKVRNASRFFINIIMTAYFFERCLFLLQRHIVIQGFFRTAVLYFVSALFNHSELGGQLELGYGIWVLLSSQLGLRLLTAMALIVQLFWLQYFHGAAVKNKSTVSQLACYFAVLFERCCKEHWPPVCSLKSVCNYDSLLWSSQRRGADVEVSPSENFLHHEKSLPWRNLSETPTTLCNHCLLILLDFLVPGFAWKCLQEEFQVGGRNALSDLQINLLSRLIQLLRLVSRERNWADNLNLLTLANNRRLPVLPLSGFFLRRPVKVVRSEIHLFFWGDALKSNF